MVDGVGARSSAQPADALVAVDDEAVEALSCSASDAPGHGVAWFSEPSWVSLLRSLARRGWRGNGGADGYVQDGGAERADIPGGGPRLVCLCLFGGLVGELPE